ncbi:MAG TPA: TolC family protein [Candidatus Limnocylindria bacterium]|nr:TolC family protein [Candidatus Limnocylindria bacterium]
MRLTKIFCALVSSLTVAASAQVVTQTPAPPAENTEQLRDAVRRALQPDAPSAPAVTTPAAAPAAPDYRATPVARTMNVGSTNVTVASLTLQDAVHLALIHNRDLQVQRYNPIISEYDRRALYSYYDPTFSSGVSRNNTEREGGGFNPQTGASFPATRTETDNLNAGLAGVLPTGMRYDVGHSMTQVDAKRPSLIGTNQFGAIFGKDRSVSWESDAAITVTQPLLRDAWIDAPRLQIKLARRNVRISELTLEREIMRIVTLVEQAYYELIGARETVRVREADVAVKKQFYDENRRRVEVGTLAPLEEKLAQSELALSESSLITARNDEISAEAILKGLIRDDFVNQLRVRLELTDKLIAVPVGVDLYENFRLAVEKRPDLQANRLNLEKQQLQLKFDYNQLFPQLDVFASWGVNGLDQSASGALDDLAKRRFQQDSYGLALSFPLWMQGPRNNYKASKNAKAQAILDLKRFEETIIQDVDFTVRQLRTQWSLIPLTRERVAYQQAALEAERKKLEFGKSTSFEVLKIASDLTSARLNEIIAVKNYNQSLAELAYRNGTTLERQRIDRPERPNQ